MKRVFFSVILLLSATFLFLCACDNAVEGVPEWQEIDSEAIDFNGASFSFGTAWIKEYAPSSGFSSAGDKMLARYEELRQTYNVDFKV